MAVSLAAKAQADTSLVSQPTGGAGTYYTITVTPTASTEVLTFAIRNDPAITNLANISLTNAQQVNVLTNGNFKSGYYTVASSQFIPTGWSYVATQGIPANTLYGSTLMDATVGSAAYVPPSSLQSDGCDLNILPCLTNGLATYHDGISQTITGLTAGATYTLTFWLSTWSDGSTGSTYLNNGNTIDTLVYFGSSLPSGYTVLATSPATNIVQIVSGSPVTSASLANIANASFAGGTLTIAGGATSIATNFDVGGVAGNTIDTAGNTATLSGNITGNGAIAVSNSGSGGKIILTGTNSFSGGLTVNTGAWLVVPDSTALGSGAINLVGSETVPATLEVTGTTTIAQNITVAGDPTFVIAPGTTTTVSGSISDGATAGDVVKEGAGTLVLSGANSYSGGTIVNAGTLQTTGSGTLGAAIGQTTVNSGATLDLGGTTQTQAALTQNGGTVQNGQANVASYTLNGGTLDATATVNSSSSILLQSGSANGVLTGSGSLAKTTTGTVTLSGANTYTGATTISQGTLALNGAGSIASSSGLVDNGTFDISGITPSSTSVKSLTGSGAVVLGAKTLAVTGGAGVYSGSISGTGGLTLTDGTLVLNGVNTATGAVNVTGATLIVGDASTPGAVVNASSGGLRLGAGGVLMGRGAILGAVTNAAGGIVRPGVAGTTLSLGSYTQQANASLVIDVTPTASSKLAVTGSAALDGTIAFNFAAGTYATRIYPVLTAAAISGSFASLSATNAPTGLVYGLYTKPGGSEVDLIVESTKGASIFGSAMTAALSMTDEIGDAVISHGADCAANAKDKPAGCKADSLWMAYIGSTSKVRAGALASIASGYRALNSGMVGGFDHHFGDGLTLGAVVGWSSPTTHDVDDASGNSTSAYAFGGYLQKNWGTAVVDAAAFYTTSTTRFHRDTLGAGLATSRADGHGFGANVRLTVPMLKGMVSPLVQLSFANQHLNAFAETDVGGLGLAIKAQDRTTLKLMIGAKLEHAFEANNLRILPKLELGYENQLAQQDRTVSGQLASVSSTSFTQSSIVPTRGAGVVKLGLVVQSHGGLTLFGDVSARINDNQDKGSARIGLRYSF